MEKQQQRVSYEQPSYKNMAPQVISGQKSSQGILASILKKPSDARIAAAIGLSHLALVYLDFSGWACPIHHVTGIPCPGCGLSRATAALLEGDWKTMSRLHIFAPLFLLTIILTGIAAVAPEKIREGFLYTLEQIENRTKITIIVIFSMLTYWGLRLILNPEAFIKLINTI